MQSCDSTCKHCFRQWISWLKQRLWQQDQPWEGDPRINFNLAAATSVKPER